MPEHVVCTRCGGTSWEDLDKGVARLSDPLCKRAKCLSCGIETYLSEPQWATAFDKKVVYTDIAIDLETMGTSGTSVICAIGASLWDSSAVGPGFYRVIEIQSSLDAGLTVDGSTIDWWLRQSEEARKAITAESVTLRDALKDFAHFMDTHMVVRKHRRVWGNGPAFDNVILANAFRACGLTTPWSHTGDRCLRTLRDLPGAPDKPKFQGVPHRADDDARNQAEHIRVITAWLQGRA